MDEKAKPAGGAGGHREFAVSDWKARQKNTLRGFLSLILPSGLILRNCTLHQKNGARWIGTPTQKYTKEDGSISFTPLVEFVTNDARQKFQAAALEAVDKRAEGAPHE